MIFAVFDPLPLTVCINCCFYIYHCSLVVTILLIWWGGRQNRRLPPGGKSPSAATVRYSNISSIHWSTYSAIGLFMRLYRARLGPKVLQYICIWCLPRATVISSERSWRLHLPESKMWKDCNFVLSAEQLLRQHDSAVAVRSSVTWHNLHIS